MAVAGVMFNCSLQNEYKLIYLDSFTFHSIFHFFGGEGGKNHPVCQQHIKQSDSLDPLPDSQSPLATLPLW